jgi:hypothetical protein
MCTRNVEICTEMTQSLLCALVPGAVGVNQDGLEKGRCYRDEGADTHHDDAIDDAPRLATVTGLHVGPEH